MSAGDWLLRLLGNPQPVYGVAGTSSNVSTALQRIGTIAFDPRVFISTSRGPAFVFSAVLETANDKPAELSLYDPITEMTVPDATLITTSTAAVLVKSKPLALPNELRLYRIYLRVGSDEPGAGSRATCTSARIDVVY